MHKDDVKKVLEAGFTILRTADYPCICIKQMSGEQSWRIKERFETKAARDREVNRIREHEPKMIFDTHQS